MGHKILIIDDDEDIADNIRILLTYEGFEVITADNIEDGLKIYYNYYTESDELKYKIKSFSF